MKKRKLLPQVQRAEYRRVKVVAPSQSDLNDFMVARVQRTAINYAGTTETEADTDRKAFDDACSALKQLNEDSTVSLSDLRSWAHWINHKED